MGITDYGHRGVPNVFLGAPLLSDGLWNSAHFKNPTYDGLVKQYIAALDLQAQRGAAKQIQELLLDETPIIFTYFYFFLATPGTSAASVITPIGHVQLEGAGLPPDDSPTPPALRRRRDEPPPRWPGFILRRIGLGPDHAVAAQRPRLLPRQRAAGQRGAPILGPFARPARSTTLNHQLGTDKPLITQYLDWMKGLLHGDLGDSLTYSQPVADVLSPALENSLKLAAAGLRDRRAASASSAASPRRSRSARPLDRIITIGGLSLTAVPEFVTGVVLIMVFGSG